MNLTHIQHCVLCAIIWLPTAADLAISRRRLHDWVTCSATKATALCKITDVSPCSVVYVSKLFMARARAHARILRLEWIVRQCFPEPGASWPGMPVMHNRCLSFGKSKQPSGNMRRQVAVGGQSGA